MTEFTWIPEYGAQADVTPSVSVSQFGDGYQQRQAKGINSIAEAWSLTFANREADESTEILAFFTARGGVEAFEWTTPENNDIVVVCAKWQKIPQKAGRWSINATFQQVFEP